MIIQWGNNENELANDVVKSISFYLNYTEKPIVLGSIGGDDTHAVQHRMFPYATSKNNFSYLSITSRGYLTWIAIGY